jgi:hypothetical protein
LSSLVLNVPYGGLFTPPAVQKRLELTTEQLGWEHFRLADPCLLKVVEEAAKEAVVEGFLGKKPLRERTLAASAFSPLVSDPLGFLAEALSTEAERGERPQFIPRTTDGRDYKPWTPEEAQTILKRSAQPYLEDILDKCRGRLEEDSLVLLLTIRSYSSRPWNYETERRYPRPQVCVGALD